MELISQPVFKLQTTGEFLRLQYPSYTDAKVYFDTVLNVAWLLMGTLAFASTLLASRRVAPERKRLAGWFQIVGVASIFVALFPYVSATDDVLCLEQWTQSEHQQQDNGKHGNNFQRLFETSNQSTVSRASSFAVTLTFVELVVVLTYRIISRSTPQSSGRSPPSAFVAA
jgi:hypothetical protein